MRNRRAAKLNTVDVRLLALLKDARRREAELVTLGHHAQGQVAVVLKEYGAHKRTCPWWKGSTKKPCTCGLHEILAKVLPTDVICHNLLCLHPIGYHIRTKERTTYCIARSGGKACECMTDPNTSVRLLDQVLGPRRR